MCYLSLLGYCAAFTKAIFGEWKNELLKQAHEGGSGGPSLADSFVCSWIYLYGGRLYATFISMLAGLLNCIYFYVGGPFELHLFLCWQAFHCIYFYVGRPSNASISMFNWQTYWSAFISMLAGLLNCMYFYVGRPTDLHLFLCCQTFWTASISMLAGFLNSIYFYVSRANKLH